MWWVSFFQPLIIFIILSLIIFYLFYLWHIKNNSEEYIYLIIASILGIIEILLWEKRFLIEINIIDYFLFYFLVKGSVTPLFRYLKPNGNKQNIYWYNFFRKSYDILTIFYFFITLFFSYIVIHYNIYHILKINNIFNFTYALIIFSLEIFIFYKTKNLKFRILIENWTTYVLLISITQLFNMFFKYNEYLDYFIITPIILFFFLTRKN